MKWTKFFIPTTKEVPADASVPSHQLMIRAGMIRQVVAGAYSYLPVGYRTLRKVENIVREEMNRAGAIELHMPAMHPVEWWEETGRLKTVDVLLRLGPPGDEDWRSRVVLGPTHEEVITEIARAYLTSYKQLPVNLYQIQTKFRGEARPKSGVLRTREFLMKDAYSFHSRKEGPGGLDETYQTMYDAYCRIFARCGLPYLVVEAESGPIGGDASHEFMVPTEAGEDILVEAEDGSYAANLERAEVAPLEDSQDGTNAPLQEVHTPGHSTIEEVSGFLGCEAAKMIKTIIYEAEGQPLVALVRGDHEVNEAKLARAARVSWVVAADAALIQKVTGAEVGFAGPVGLNARFITDQAVSIMHDGVTGANKTDYHITGVNPGRDFEMKEIADIRMAVEGDRAPNGSALVFRKCIEVGHVFKLGTKYSDAMKAHYIDTDGKSKPLIMGCYGIGVNRIMAAAIESMHDDKGICWPVSIAPFQVVICALDLREQEVVKVAEKLHDELEAAGVDVLLDDRDARPGFKFNDAELIGVPIRITVGKRGLADGIVEITTRHDHQTQKVPPDQAVATVRRLIDDLTPNCPLKKGTGTSPDGVFTGASGSTLGASPLFQRTPKA
ncbi:MAG: proline--tRNA ligase [Phycisphaerales bacterium]|nr:MAG: proline--tRNA ligase [Phycisphaerales bacterium]